MKTCALVVMLALTATAILEGQGISGFVTPNPAPPGAQVTLTIVEAQGMGVGLPTLCAFQAVHSGSPTGPIVFSPFCVPVFLPLPPCGVWSQDFLPPPNVQAGTYWFEVVYFPLPFIAPVSEFISFTYQPATFPTLASQTPAQIGTDLFLTIAAPGFGSSIYLTAASGTTNSGFPAGPNLYVSLDLDPIFFLSFPSPDPILFSNFQGSLDSFGNASGIAIHIPPIVELLCKPLSVQAAIIDSAGIPQALTNPLSFSVQ